MKVETTPFYMLDPIPLPELHQVARYVKPVKQRLVTLGWPLRCADPLPYRWVTQ